MLQLILFSKADFTYVPCKCVFCLSGNNTFYSRLSYLDQRHDLISFTTVDEHKSIHYRNIYPPPNIFLFTDASHYGWGVSFRANETSLSWSLDGRPIPAPYRVRNDGHMLSTETSHNIYSPFLCHDIHRQYDSGLIYQQTGWNTFSRSFRRGMGDFQYMPGT